MGNEIPENERNIRFELFHVSIYWIEKEIKAELNNQNIKVKKMIMLIIIILAKVNMEKKIKKKWMM